ncbi:MAG: NusG domain II-containing protein [Lachnospiraceae bacterium]|nr:NusG domain II-containing protein [Lachnospiraceae bacterium]
MERRFGKNDIILLSAIVILTLGFLVGMTQLLHQGQRILITVDGEIYGSYLLSETQDIEIRKDGAVVNIVRIENGRAHMSMADCPDHLCQKQGEIEREGESIICLPNRVVAAVQGTDGENREMDAIAR